MSLLYKEESYNIRGAIFDVYNEIGCGFAESVYHECLEREFGMRGIEFESKKQISLVYKEGMINEVYVPDFVCFDKIVVEIVAVPDKIDSCRANMINVLKVTGKRIGFLANFGLSPKAEIVRVVL